MGSSPMIGTEDKMQIGIYNSPTNTCMSCNSTKALAQLKVPEFGKEDGYYGISLCSDCMIKSFYSIKDWLLGVGLIRDR